VRQQRIARRQPSARSAAAVAGASVMVLEAGGQILKNGQFVLIKMSVKPEFAFKAFVTPEGTSTPLEEEVECENFLEQAKVQRDLATDTWRFVEPHPVEICEGSPWLEEAVIHNRLAFFASGEATDELSIVLTRSPETVRAEERKQAEKEEPIHAREPLRCEYITTTSKGKFKSHLTGKKPKPLEAKIKGKVAMRPVPEGKGCGLKRARWKSSYTLTANKGQPVFSEFVAGPNVTGLSPAEGPEGGGTSVQISGSGFTGATGVTFGTTSATFKVNSDSSITAAAPSGTGAEDVKVTTPISTSTASPADQFTYDAPPTVTEILPKVGLEEGGTEVTITGTNFTSGSTVKFGTTAATSVKFTSATSLTATSPPGTGTVDVTVTTAGGTSMTSSADQFTY